MIAMQSTGTLLLPDENWVSDHLPIGAKFVINNKDIMQKYLVEYEERKKAKALKKQQNKEILKINLEDDPW